MAFSLVVVTGCWSVIVVRGLVIVVASLVGARALGMQASVVVALGL